LTYVGTVKKNKPEIPSSFLTRKGRLKNSAKYAYHNELTLLSYCPNKKVKKLVILLSTTHDLPDKDKTVRIPEIVDYYNKNKGGVDVLDRMCKNYSTSRNTKRWTVCCNYGFLNVVGVNIFVLWKLNKEEEQSRKRTASGSRTRKESSSSSRTKRSEFLKSLALKLITPHLRERLKSTSGLQSDLRGLIERVLGIKESTVQQSEAVLPCSSKSTSLKESKGKTPDRGYCAICKTQTRTKCEKCCRWICSKHQTVLCTTCVKSCK
jgi:hypothetical protein